MKAISAGVSIYAAHTSADKVLAGVSGDMARRLGLSDVEVLQKDGDQTGLGVVGNLPAPMSSAEVVDLVKKAFDLRVMKASMPLDGKISRVAMCGGSGGSLISEARRSGAQLYISGDISYHNFFTEDGFMIMDIGHYESEIGIVEILFALLKKNFPTFAVRITQNLNSNPIYYF
jgi:putative NIF3 family GTP cyclohydrolase 1 type 2